MCCKTGRCITPRDQCRSSFVLDEPGIFRFLALWTLIGSRIIINTLQLWLCITQFCPDGFVSDRNHHCSTNITRFLFFRKSIYINILCRKISKDLIISSFRFTGLLVCFYLMYSTSRGTGSGSSSVCRWNRSNCPGSCSCRISLVEPKSLVFR